MKHLSRLVILLILTVNALFTVLFVLSAYSPYIQPTVHPVRSCLGLAFPFFLVINGCFLLFWLVIRQYKAALLPLAGAIICFAPTRTYIPINIMEEKVPEKHIKFLSYNIMGVDNMKKGKEGNPILTYLQESKADIICLQEYSTLNAINKSARKEIKRTLKDYPYYSVDVVGTQTGYTNYLVCFSKHPILSAKVLDCNSKFNGAVRYEIKIDNDTLSVINCHLESNKLTEADKAVYKDMLKDPEKEKVKSGSRLLIGKLAEAAALRAPQAEVVAAEVAATKHPYVIVCGDFNDTPISYSHRVINDRLNDAFVESGNGLGISYNRNYFYFRIDHILLSSNLRSYSCTVDRSIKDSDHYPIWCYITKKED